MSNKSINIELDQGYRPEKVVFRIESGFLHTILKQMRLVNSQ
jgi:hypothetical protein